MSPKKQLSGTQSFTEHPTQAKVYPTTAFEVLAVGDLLMDVAPSLPLQRGRDT